MTNILMNLNVIVDLNKIDLKYSLYLYLNIMNQVTTKEKKNIYCIYEGVKRLFVPINDKKNDNSLLTENNISFYDLDEKNIFGKILINLEGYNPSGWWKYINVDKKDLFYE